MEKLRTSDPQESWLDENDTTSTHHRKILTDHSMQQQRHILSIVLELIKNSKRPVSNFNILPASPLHSYKCIFRWFNLLVYHLKDGQLEWTTKLELKFQLSIMYILVE